MKKRYMKEIQERIDIQKALVEKDNEFANLKETVICLEDQNRNYQELIESSDHQTGVVYGSAP